MPSLGSGEAVAVARITLSPLVVRAAPGACLAIRPVSNLMCLPPASSTVTSCFMVCLFSVFSYSYRLMELVRGLSESKARGKMQHRIAGPEIPGTGRGLHHQNLNGGC